MDLTEIRIRFENKYIPEPNSGCWLWTGSASNERAHFWFDGKLHPASRISWMLKHGEMPPKELLVCHTCDIGYCVNPNHLFLSTASDNMRDMARKGRAYLQKYPERSKVGDMNRSKTHCKHGHPLTEDNIYIESNSGHRGCKTCKNLRNIQCRKNHKELLALAQKACEERDRYKADVANLKEQLAAREDMLFNLGAMETPPCFCCGYSGAGYFNPDTHPCAARHVARRTK